MSATVLNELRAITNDLRALFPGCTTALTIPTKPVSGLWVVRHENVKAEQISAGVDEITREFTVIVHHELEEVVIEQMGTFHERVRAGHTANGDGVAVRYTGLGFSSPVKLDGGLYALLGTLKTTCRALTEAARDYGTEPLISGVHANILKG